MIVTRHQHILVWRLSAMGDVAMTVPVIQQLQNTYPNTKITVVSKPFLKPIFKGIPNLHFVAAEVNGRHKGLVGLYKLFNELKSLEITHVADLHNVLRSKIMRILFKFSKVKLAAIDKGRIEKRELTQPKPKRITPLKSTHERYADVFDRLGFPLQLALIKRKKQPMNSKLELLVGIKTEPWIGLAPFAAFQGKTYPLELMQQTIQGLSELQCKVFLFGGGSEEIKKLEMIRSNLPNIISVAGKLSFEDELSLISNLNLMISMDSGNGHLAAMFGVETLTLWGVTHPYAGFAPYGQSEKNQLLPDMEKYPLLPCSIYGNKVFPGYKEVMFDIKPSAILKRVEILLKEKEL